ncbi:hypothetical protein Bca4012_034847 [Brassica carinata]
MRHSVMLMVSCVFTFLVLNNVQVEVDGLKPLFCPTQGFYKGVCGKDGINLCVKDVKDWVAKGTGKPLPKNYGVRCDKCIDEAPRKGYLRMHQCICKHDC